MKTDLSYGQAAGGQVAGEKVAGGKSDGDVSMAEKVYRL